MTIHKATIRQKQFEDKPCKWCCGRGRNPGIKSNFLCEVCDGTGKMVKALENYPFERYEKIYCQTADRKPEA